ncbi:MAG: CPBP family glutamic-type intramembrane protease [Sandaracinaceae bacterium]
MSTDRQRQARRGLAVYLGVVILLSGIVEGAILWLGGGIGEHGLLVLALMWSPAVAMVVARLVLREGIRDVSFRLGLRDGGWREYLIAWLYAAVLGGLAYGIGWASGLVPFAVPSGPMKSVAEVAGPIGALFASLGMSLTLITALSAITATGEELGWRGYMLTRLIDAGVPRPLLVSGVIWGLWHAPLILSGQYASGPYPVLSVICFVVSITATSYVFARVRLTTGSVWSAALFHASWNAVIQATYDEFVPGHDAAHAGNISVGESGILVVVAEVIFALVLVARPFRVKRAPADEATETMSIANG